jgi:hypothetical protein
MPIEDESLETMIAPLGSVISRVAQSVGIAQVSLDRSSIALASEIAKDPDLAAIGYQPTFYVIPEVVVELKINMHLSEVEEKGRSFLRLLVEPLNGRTKTAKSTAVDATSSLRFRIVPVPRELEKKK